MTPAYEQRQKQLDWLAKEYWDLVRKGSEGRPVTCSKLLEFALRTQDYAGLCNENCGCGVDDLAPCGDGPFKECQAAHRVQIKEELIDGVVLTTNGRVADSDLRPGDYYYYPVSEKKHHVRTENI